MKQTIKPRLRADDYIAGISRGDRVMLGQAITLVESNLPADQVLAATVMEGILPKTGTAIRIGITGTPGVGKSTFIEAFGKHIVSTGKRLAVLTIDPSSQLTRGSILGDKTRMEDLSKNQMAFIRPSATGETLGGVAGKTREAMLLCEAAGYDVIIIETVGVGQSETSVKKLVDFFLLLMLAGAGDELQGIKKGIMEMADAVVITKADGDNIRHATEAQGEYQQALHLMSSRTSGWTPQVLTSSALSGAGIDEVWKMIVKYNDVASASGYFSSHRQTQDIAWLQEYFDQLLLNEMQDAGFAAEKKRLEKKVADQTLSAQAAARELLAYYHNSISTKK